MLLSFSGDKGQQKQGANDDDGHNEQEKRFETRWQERQDGVDPQERKIRLRGGLNDRGIWRSSRTERPEEEDFE